MKRLCIYYSRSGTTKDIMNKIAERTGAEIVSITDGKSRKGTFGFLGAIKDSAGKDLPAVKEPITMYPLSEYDEVILGAPIWAESWCLVMRGFLREHGMSLPENVSFVFTHMSEKGYEECAAEADEFLMRPHKALLTVCTKKDSYVEIERFINTIINE